MPLPFVPGDTVPKFRLPALSRSAPYSLLSGLLCILLAGLCPTPVYAQDHCNIDPRIGDNAEFAADYFVRHSELIGIFLVEGRAESGAEQVRLIRAYKGQAGQRLRLAEKPGNDGVLRMAVGSFSNSIGVEDGELAFAAIDFFSDMHMIFPCTTYILDRVPLGELLLALERRARAEPSAAAP